MRKPMLLALLVLVIAYVASYWIIRESNTLRYDKDGCPVRGCEEVTFPGDGAYIIYAPIYILDKYTDSETDFVLVRRD
jgi:hypothetical protein